MQSCQSNEKREELKKKSMLEVSVTRDSRPVEDGLVDSQKGDVNVKRETGESVVLRPENVRQTGSYSELSASESEELPLKLTQSQVSVDVTKSLNFQKTADTKFGAKKNGVNRRPENPSSYKVNSVSLLNMLQNKTLNLIKQVL